MICLVGLFLLSIPRTAPAQQTNPTERKVENPITDTPNVNPLSQEQPPIRAPRPNGIGAKTGAGTPLQSTDELDVRADRNTVSGPEKARVSVYEGNVDARVGIYRLQADKVSVYEATNKVVAEGNVVFDQGEFQRITGTRAEWNYATKLGFFVNSTGFTNQTQDGTVLYFTAERVEKVSGNRVVILNGVITACDEETPKWSFRAKRAEITLNDRVRIKSPTFRVKGVPVIYLPYASISIKPKDRASGFLTPTFGGSGQKGFRLSNAYYQTLGRSADVTLRNDIYTSRGLGLGADVRTRANSRSYLNLGFYTVKDRIFGAKPDDQHRDQGGSSFYVDGVHYFPNGFLAAADINITSNLAFRQIFSDSIQQAISPEERSQVFVNKNFGDYSFNFLARTQVTSIPNVRIRTRQLPSIELDKRPSPLSFFEKLPLYFSFEGSLDGVSRKETVEDLGTFQSDGNVNPIVTPSLVQRLDFHPTFTVPLSLGGWGVTASAGVRGTYYSNSLDPVTRLVLPRNVVRGYGELSLDLRPPALARNFRRKDGTFWFRHVIEPYFTYRKISGISNFERIIRFDTLDAIADTNEIEYGVTNRFFTRRSSETVTGRVSAKKNGAGDAGQNILSARDSLANLPPLTQQPYEFLSVTIRQKYFFDPNFGGALIPGRRNQFYPINTFSGFTYGGVPRRFSPLNIEARLRSVQKSNRELYADVRTDVDTLGTGGGLRDLAVSFGFKRPAPRVHLIEAFQTFYYTRAVTLAPSLRQFSDRRGNEPGTLQGSQWSPSIFLGDRDRGLYGGASFFFEFQNRPGRGNNSLVSSTTTVGYAWDCCSVTAQYTTFNVGLRQEKRSIFSFRLNGIGSFGTEKYGQRF
ncbi:MAG: LPS assembly protein LptD [Pyrinomonadaceae bacterium]